MTEPTLRCAECTISLRADMTTLTCLDCESPLEVDYPGHDYGSATPPMPVPKQFLESATLGEGNTPIVNLPAVASRLGIRSLDAKLEYINPTGSFKDRGTAVVIAAAKRHGVSEVVEDSSGNAGASVSAYAARAGMTAHIFAPSSAPQAKLRQIVAYGAQVHSIPGPREATTAAAIEYATEHSLVYASHVLSPYFVEGTKLFAYEIFHQSGDSMPKHIVMPVGNGSLLLGALKGFSELKRGGHIADIPRLHAVQAKSVMPIVAAFHDLTDVPPVQTTVAGGIAVGTPARLEEIVTAIKTTDGTATAVEENDILSWRDTLAHTEGIYGEPTSAAAFASLAQLLQQGIIQPHERVLVPITGFGLKDTG
ncbi:MAG: threonine synthase [Dehalococcoidia bacterium]|nr:threonine synthase [Dehalococcoidia bacterium]